MMGSTNDEQLGTERSYILSGRAHTGPTGHIEVTWRRRAGKKRSGVAGIHTGIGPTPPTPAGLSCCFEPAALPRRSATRSGVPSHYMDVLAHLERCGILRNPAREPASPAENSHPRSGGITHVSRLLHIIPIDDQVFISCSTGYVMVSILNVTANTPVDVSPQLCRNDHATRTPRS